MGTSERRSQAEQSALDTSRSSATLDEVVAEAGRRARRTQRNHRLFIVTMQGVVAAAFIVGWQLLSGDPRTERFVLIDIFYVSQPSDIAGALRDWVADGDAFHNTLITTQETLGGFAIGASLGLAAGLLLASFRTVGSVLSPFISALYSVPRLALVPLFVIWFGIGFQSKVVFVAMIVFFLVFFNTFSGGRDVSSNLVNILRVMGARRRHMIVKVILPSAMAWILAGLRISVPYSLVAAVTAEIISSNAGLGYLMVRSSSQFYMEGVFASIILMVALSLTMLAVVVGAERFLLRWKD